MIKHATSGVFVFCEVEARWRLGLIEHPRLGRHMVVSGHVEADETQAEAAVREAVAASPSPSPVSEPVHPIAWFTAVELAGLAMFEDTRLLAGTLFPRIAELVAADAAGPVDVLAIG